MSKDENVRICRGRWSEEERGTLDVCRGSGDQGRAATILSSNVRDLVDNATDFPVVADEKRKIAVDADYASTEADVTNDSKDATKPVCSGSDEDKKNRGETAEEGEAEEKGFAVGALGPEKGFKVD